MNREEIQALLNTLPKRKAPKARYIKPDSVKAFENKYHAWYWSKHPNQTPYKHTFRDDKANELTKLIQAYCRVHGYFAARVNTTGIFDQKLGMWRKSGSTKGMADITAVINGKHISIEIKAGNDKPRSEQLKVKREVEAAGGCYWFIHTFDEFLNHLADNGFQTGR